MSATGTLAFGRNTTAKLALTGSGVRQDNGNYQSLVSGYELQLASPRKPVCTRQADQRRQPSVRRQRPATGRVTCSTSVSPPTAALKTGEGDYFAISAFGPWRTPASNVEYDVFIDTNGDGKADAILRNTRVHRHRRVRQRPGQRQDSGDVIGDSVVPDQQRRRGGRHQRVQQRRDGAAGVDQGADRDVQEGTRAASIHYWVAAETLESGLTDVSKKAEFNVLHPA